MIKIAGRLCFFILSIAYRLEGRKLAEMTHKSEWKTLEPRK